MRTLCFVIATCFYCEVADCQLIRSDLPNGTVVEKRSEIPPKLDADATLHFLLLDLVFDGGSQVAKFRRGDGNRLDLWFPHDGYWTERARHESLQPVAVYFVRGKSYGLAEVVRNSPLEKRLIELVSEAIEEGRHTPAASTVLRQVRDTIRSRKPLAGDEWDSSWAAEPRIAPE